MAKRTKGINVIELLKKDDKGISETHGTGGMLSRLFRVILDDTKMTIKTWSQLANEYARDRQNNFPINERDTSTIKGNITKEIIKPEMTWKVFCKALQFLQIFRFDLTITAYHRHHPPTVHTIEVNIRRLDIDDAPEGIDPQDDLPF